MQWRKMGLVWSPDGSQNWQHSCAGLPTPIALDDERLRVFMYCLSAEQIGRIGYVDVSAANPMQVLDYSVTPVLDIGRPGCFDDHGVVPVSVVRIDDGRLYLYYVGFELCHQIRYRLFTGLAISDDNGASFHKASQVPVLDRSDQELFFRCGSHVRYENGVFRLWYIGGSHWRSLHGKQVPIYDMRYLESDDGIHWGPVGEVILSVDETREHGFGRPCVVAAPQGGYEMFFSSRSLLAGEYRFAYASSSDGLTWTRRDENMTFSASALNWDSRAQCFPAVITHGNQRYMFYNGNNFGADGFGLAIQDL